MTQTSSPRTTSAHAAQRWLFTVTALLEASAGLGLLGIPGTAIALIFGIQEPSPEALIVGRIGGAALLAIGVACWIARDDDGSRSQHGLLWGMILYNVGACAVLAFAGATLKVTGFALWPVALLHAFMAIWCAMSLRASTRRQASD